MNDLPNNLPVAIPALPVAISDLPVSLPDLPVGISDLRVALFAFPVGVAGFRVSLPDFPAGISGPRVSTSNGGINSPYISHRATNTGRHYPFARFGMHLRFTKENMFTAAGFVRDSYLTDQADFVAVAPKEFDAAFDEDLRVRLAKIKGATGGALRTGSGAQVTARLYQNLDAVKPLLDRLDIRLGFIPKEKLTVAPGKFGLKTLRERIDHRDAEATSRALTVLQQAIADNLSALEDKGYPATEQQELTRLHGLIDADNATQNTTLNANTKATGLEDADYLALDALLSKIMRTGRLLYKATKAKRRQYEVAAITQRVQAAQHPAGDTKPAK